MAKYYGDACISDGEYEKDGEKRKKWMKIGTVIQQDSGSLSIHLPLFDKWVNIFPKQQQGQGQQQQRQYREPSREEFTGNAPPPPPMR